MIPLFRSFKMSQETLNNVDSGPNPAFGGGLGKVSTHIMRVSRLSRIIHGWSWQAVSLKSRCFTCRAIDDEVLVQFPIGMGTGAVYVCLAGVDPTPPHGLQVIQNIFYFLNIAFFLINAITLLLQFIRTCPSLS